MVFNDKLWFLFDNAHVNGGSRVTEITKLSWLITIKTKTDRIIILFHLKDIYQQYREKKNISEGLMIRFNLIFRRRKLVKLNQPLIFPQFWPYNRITISSAVLWKNCRLQTPQAYVFPFLHPSSKNISHFCCFIVI